MTSITGASSGIGFHLAEKFASYGPALYLVAPDAGELEKLSVPLKERYNTDFFPNAGIENLRAFQQAQVMSPH